MARFIAANCVRLPTAMRLIDRIFPFGEAVEAVRYYEAGQYFGKIVINQA